MVIQPRVQPPPTPHPRSALELLKIEILKTELAAALAKARADALEVS
jgi:hypothetical protein